MYRVSFMGAKRRRDALGYENRDDALAFLAKNAASIVADVRITSDDGVVERLPASKDPTFYKARMSTAMVLVVERPKCVLPVLQATVVRRLLGMGTPDSIKTLRAVAKRHGLEVPEDDAVLRQRLGELASEALA